MSVQTIDDVVSALNVIVQQSYDQASRLGYFAALYRRVTCAVRDGIAAGSFQNGPLMEQLDVVFASRYLDAFITFQAGGTATRSWMLAFQGCSNPDLLILQQLLSENECTHQSRSWHCRRASQSGESIASAQAGL